MAFSGALTLTDLNDYLGPSQACIKPVQGADTPNHNVTTTIDPIHPAASASTQIAIDHDGSYYESFPSSSTSSAVASTKPDDTTQPKHRTKLETAQISLNDCLACSGCVTSAESVLITMQSHQELRRAVTEINASDQPKLLVASISTQSLASLSANYTFQHHHQQHTSPNNPAAQPQTSTTSSSSSPQQSKPPLPLPVLLHRISYFLKTVFKFDHVYDTTFARHITLKEHQREFFQRRANSYNPSNTNTNHHDYTRAPTLPMLASACPGWICYAEKTHPELLPYISTTKSPQQVAGVIAKRFLPHRIGLLSNSHSAQTSSSSIQSTRSSIQSTRIYHVTVMPCYDKKLEASRSDFYDEITNTKEVDCALTTGELDKLMLDENFDICTPVPGEQQALQQSFADLSLEHALNASLNQTALDDSVSVLPHFPQLLDQPGSSSGGYLFNLMRAVWLDWISQHWQQFPQSVRDQAVLPKLDVRVIRTADFTEYVLRAPTIKSEAQSPPSSSSFSSSSSSSSILFRAAQCYGFRNLQNLVRKLQKQTGVRNARGAAARLVDSNGNAVVKTGTAGRNRASAARARVRGVGGMIRRGRGVAAVESAFVNKSSPLNPDSDAIASLSNNQLNTAHEEEERGYDYVEVMACPSGCVNGGGQIRPPTQADVVTNHYDDITTKTDPEGYTQGGWVVEQSSSNAAQPQLEDELDSMLNNKSCINKSQQQRHNIDGEHVEIDGVDMMQDETKGEKQIKGWQGTSKEWVRRVEEAYWQGSRVAHTNLSANGEAMGDGSGASTPTLVNASGANTPLSNSHSKSIRVQDHQRLLESLAITQQNWPRDESNVDLKINKVYKIGKSEEEEEEVKMGQDTMAYADILAELVVRELSTLGLPGGSVKSEVELNSVRDRLFRTQYRSVQDETVNGLAVQW
ncbi:related to Cytosolic Fe-S cluster assembly factor NAR1 [Melanopsichium pennsylvanicum]|uniref:Cytosolic Fe-S cluster assembly factor NAR1 n=2 Tax=Melanopsichium pennsylvanicum TaxID=63383 RepID=A0AAJ4XLV2_9BASI|nr:related to NAR1-similarity to human nuclear prelamin A recognition factor [Melanopsichium pennsylvanicum 4]SNX84528.1 related to Cytosolic Fe-S cluster assembly factor NAR1 [Melanopsichium pennsylvanicum]